MVQYLSENTRIEAGIVEKGNREMNLRIAVTYDKGEIFQHFGHTSQFKIYEVEDGQVVEWNLVDTEGEGHSALTDFLFQNMVDILICGGIGEGAQSALSEVGIQLYGGVSGSADAAVRAYLEGKLKYSPQAACAGHDHGDGHSCGGHGGEHTCGSHGCGSCHHN